MKSDNELAREAVIQGKMFEEVKLKHHVKMIRKLGQIHCKCGRTISANKQVCKCCSSGLQRVILI